MSRIRLWLAAAALILVAALIFMPLRIIVGGDGISARRVDGIIWDGSVRDLRVGQMAIGDVNARLHFWPLLLARATLSLSRGDAAFAPGISGSVTRRIGGFEVTGLKATLPVQALFAPLPADNIELQDFSVRFIAGRCAEAGGNVRLTLTGTLPGVDLANGLLAKPRCEGGKLLIPLLSQSAMEKVTIRIAGDGSYDAAIFLEGDRAEQSALLVLAGFRAAPGGYRMTRKGRF
jgi:general secretion pathway protein N